MKKDIKKESVCGENFFFGWLLIIHIKQSFIILLLLNSSKKKEVVKVNIYIYNVCFIPVLPSPRPFPPPKKKDPNARRERSQKGKKCERKWIYTYIQ